MNELWPVDPFSRSLVIFRGGESSEGDADATLTTPLLPGVAASAGELIPAV